MPSRRARPALSTLLLFLALTLPALAGLISQEQEINIGREGARQLEQKYRVVTELPVQERITRIGQALASQGTRGLTYHFKVIDVRDINALAFPGGFIYATRGLMEAMPDGQLAFVMGHEVAHVEKRHSVQQMETQIYTQVGVGALISIFGGGRVDEGTANTVRLANAMASSRYSQDAEREADREGMMLMGRAGFDPQGAVQALETLKRLDGGQEVPGFLNSLLGSHPLTSERIPAARELAPQVPYQPAPAAPQPVREEEPPRPQVPTPLFTPVP